MRKLLVILFITSSLYAQDGTLKLWDNPLGVNNSVQSHAIGDTEFTDLSNLYTDDGMIAEVDGIKAVWCSSGPVRYMKEFTRLSGERYMVWVDSNALNIAKSPGTYTTYVSTLDPTCKIWSFQYSDTLYLGGNKTETYTFDGTTLAVSSYSINAKYGIISDNRAVFANLNSATTKSKVQYTNIDNLNGYPGDYYIYLKKDDGEEITGLIKYKDDVIGFKPHSMHKILGLNTDTNEDDDSVCISNDVGCIGGDITEHNGYLYWVSEYGIIEYDGTNYKIITYDIKTTMAVMSELKSGLSYAVETTGPDFGKGTLFINVDTTTTLGQVKPQSKTSFITETSTHQIQGIKNSIGAGYSGDNMDYSDSASFQIIKPSVTCLLTDVELLISSGVISGPHPGPGPTNNLRVYFCDISSNVISTSDSHTFTLTTTRWIKCHFTDTIWLSSGTQYMIKPKCDVTNNAGVGCYSNTNTYNRGTSNIAGGDLCFSLITSTSPSFTSDIIHTNNLENKTWKMWDTVDYTAQDITMSYRTGGSDGEVTGQSFTNIADAGVIVSTIGPKIQYKVLFNFATSYLSDVQINYLTAGNPDTISMLSDKINNRVFVGCTLEPSTDPNKILVYQLNNTAWTFIDGLNIRSMAYYNYEQYWGDISGHIMRVSEDYDDFNGTAISPYLITKDFNFGDGYADKTMTTLWTDFEPYTGSASVGYFLNKSTTAVATYSQSLVTSGLYSTKPVTTKIFKDVGRFRYIRFKVSNFDVINGMEFNFKFVPRQ